ncbi:drug/metabolite transporter (DMT)-like permease [Loktanella ponticola]|uniref:Drug/metabolite transporter (DMT)-like permease n=1 Tax=Yoonia ponticola TaxID=1524255 RepID=A0A7W9BHE4_9RHOB|nr:DMT family transporter [Yoonia ponticola]MBB5720603.1 drug/metabolite transporter (DMT)-like permease [Yoonia ponticola]
MATMTERTRGTLEMAAAMFLSGTLGFFVVESGQGAYNVVFFRCLFGAGFLFAFCLARGFLRNTGLTRMTLLMTLAGGIAIVANWVLLFSSYAMASISASTAVYHTQPFFLLLIGAVILREAIPRNKITWIVVAFVGVMMVVNIDLSSLSFSSDYVAGLGLALSAAVLYAIATMITKQLKGIRPHVIALIQVSLGAVLLLPFANFGALGAIEGVQWGYLVILGGVHTCLMYILLYSAFQKLPTAVIAVMSFVYPVVAIGVDYIFYDQSLSGSQLAGIGLIMFGSFAVNQNLPLKPRFGAAPKPAADTK